MLNYKERNISKFGLDKEDKHITFQHDWGNKGYITGRSGRHTKIWETKHWKRLLENVKRELKKFKIVQVGYKQ